MKFAENNESDRKSINKYSILTEIYEGKMKLHANMQKWSKWSENNRIWRKEYEKITCGIVSKNKTTETIWKNRLTETMWKNNYVRREWKVKYFDCKNHVSFYSFSKSSSKNDN